MAVGANYGFANLTQLDIRASKRFKLDNVRFRVDFDAYNLTNSNWPFTVNSFLDRRDERVAAPDQRAPGAIFQDRRELRLLAEF